MHAPFCDYEVYSHEWRISAEIVDHDAIAIPRKCGHVNHAYFDFEAKLKRFNPNLRLGFDLKDGMYVIFRWGTELHEMPIGEHKSMLHSVRFLQRVMDLKYGVDKINKLGKHYFEIHRLPPGDWALRRLAHLRPGAMTFDTSWFGKQTKKHLENADANRDKRMSTAVDGICNDMMSLADRGNPNFIKKQFHVNRTLEAVHA